MSSMMFWGFMAGSPIITYLSYYIANKLKLIMLGTLIMFLLFLLLIYTPVLSFTTIYCLTFLIGFIFPVQLINFRLLKDVAPIQHTATAFSFACMLGSFPGYFSPLVGSILDWTWQGNLDKNGVHVFTRLSYQEAFIIIPLGLLISLILTFYLNRRTNLTTNHHKPVIENLSRLKLKPIAH